MRKLSDREIKESEILNGISSHDEICRRAKEVKEIQIKNLEDMKKAAELLSSKNWIAIYAVCNESNVIMTFIRIT